MMAAERKPRVVRRGTPAAEPIIRPIRQEARVSQTANELLEDYRQASFTFAHSETNVEDNYVAMQMRYYELARYVGQLEQAAEVRTQVTMKF